jgi:hypothetical protein
MNVYIFQVCIVWLLGGGDVAGAYVFATMFYAVMGGGFGKCPYSLKSLSWWQEVGSQLYRKIKVKHKCAYG